MATFKAYPTMAPWPVWWFMAYQFALVAAMHSSILWTMFGFGKTAGDKALICSSVALTGTEIDRQSPSGTSYPSTLAATSAPTPRSLTSLARRSHASKCGDVAMNATIDRYTAESSSEFRTGIFRSSETPALIPTDSPSSYAPFILGKLIACKAMLVALFSQKL